MLKFSVFLFIILLSSCDDGSNPLVQDSDPVSSDSWLFVANEGNFQSTNGSVSMIAENGEVYETDILGDVVQSLEVYENKLIVLINNSHKLKIYNITTEGLSMPGFEFDLGGSSPREMVVVDDKVYFTNWNSEDIKIFNLFNYVFEDPILVGAKPSGIIEKNGSLWVAIEMESDWSPGSHVKKYNIETGALEGVYYVSSGPNSLEFVNDKLYVSRTYYDADFNTSHGMSMIDGDDVINAEYGTGVACGGSILNISNQIYRTLSADRVDGGIVALNESLNFDENIKIGSYQQSYIYHVDIIDGYVWFAVTNSDDYNYIKKTTLSGQELDSYQVGIAPGDFAKWPNTD